MAKRTGPTNPYLRSLIEELKIKARELQAPIWRTVAEKLSKPTRQRVEVNIGEIERYANPGETILVPGVVLANGVLTKPVNVAAWRFSTNAAKKIKETNGKILTIEELLKENPKGTGVKIMV
jgi:large subunit ribosomal protein L18e